MRLWHKDLISVLPKNQLLGQWRECCLIAKNIAEKSTPSHILVNKIMDYPIEHFIAYTDMVKNKMKKRGYHCDTSRFTKWLQWEQFKIYPSNIFADWHNDRYLSQCFYNLQEKYDCSGISETEYGLIKRKVLEIKK
jgi:uncharacterized protein (TIGR02328 family)